MSLESLSRFLSGNLTRRSAPAAFAAAAFAINASLNSGEAKKKKKKKKNKNKSKTKTQIARYGIGELCSSSEQCESGICDRQQCRRIPICRVVLEDCIDYFDCCNDRVNACEFADWVGKKVCML